MSIKKIVVSVIAAVTIAFAASAVALPSPATAQTPVVSATCSTLSVNLTDYGLDPYGASVNRVVVTVDQVVVTDVRFGTSFASTFDLGDNTLGHSYAVAIDAFGAQYDTTITGTSSPCAPPVVNDASAAVLATLATCDAAGTLVLGAAENATWGAPTNTTGPAAYSVTATADAGHAFADGAASVTFTGTLAGRMDPTAAPCSTVVVPERPLPVLDVTNVASVDCATMTRTMTTTTSTTDWALDASSNTWVAAAAVVNTSTATALATAEECAATVVVPALPGTPGPVTLPATPANGLVPAALVAPAVRTAPLASAVAAEPLTPTLTLASTGSDADHVLAVGVALLLAGAALVIARRRRAANVFRDGESAL